MLIRLAIANSAVQRRHLSHNNTIKVSLAAGAVANFVNLIHVSERSMMKSAKTGQKHS